MRKAQAAKVWLFRLGALGFFLIFGVAADITRAQWEALPQERVPRERPGIPARIDHRHLQFMGFDIHDSTEDKMTLVRLKLGKARESGPENISDCSCYVASSEKDETAIEFCTGPVGGFNNLTSFRIVAGENRYFDRKLCAKSDKVNAQLATASGLRLGLDKDVAREILGKPTEENEFVLHYVYHLLIKRSYENLTDSPQISDCNTDQTEGCYRRTYSEVLVNFLDGKVSGFSVSNGIAW